MPGEVISAAPVFLQKPLAGHCEPSRQNCGGVVCDGSHET